MTYALARLTHWSILTFTTLVRFNLSSGGPMTKVMAGAIAVLGAVLLGSVEARALPPVEKLNWGPEYYATTCRPALQTRVYADLWPFMTQQERQAVSIAQQETYVREQELYRSWVRAFEKVVKNPEQVKRRGQLYPGPVYDNLAIETASRGAADTLAACVEHMAKQLEIRR